MSHRPQATVVRAAANEEDQEDLMTTVLFIECGWGAGSGFAPTPTRTCPQAHKLPRCTHASTLGHTPVRDLARPPAHTHPRTRTTDQHGQNPTKAAVRACRNAIEFNSLPSIRNIVPGGYDNMKLRIQIAVPDHDQVHSTRPDRVRFPLQPCEITL